MNQSDIQFRKNCQLYHTKIRKLLKNGRIEEAKELIKNIGGALSQWENNFRSTRFKLNLLRNVYSDLTVLERKASYNLDRRQRDDSKQEEGD